MQHVTSRRPDRSPTLLFDLGGVLYEAATFDALNAMLGTDHPECVLKDRWLRSPAVRGFERGRISPHDFATRLLDEWQIALTEEAFIADFTAWVRRPYEGAETLLERLRATYRVACLSNSNELHWTRFGAFLECFDVAFSSHLLGEIKPDERVFQKVVSELCVDAGSLYFFDDSILNVEAAQRLGIKAFLVDGIEAVERSLRAERLL